MKIEKIALFLCRLPLAGQLAMAVEQVEELGLQRRAGPVGVKIR